MTVVSAVGFMSLGNAPLTASAAARCDALIGNAFELTDPFKYIELVYNVSPPGNCDAKMTGMMLRLSFGGDIDGKISISWKWPDKFREEGFYQFGLDVIEVLKDFDAYDPNTTSGVSSC